MGELAQLLDQSQPRVSRHVRILAEAGLVRRQKEGAWAFVGRANAPMAEAARAMVAASGEDPIDAERARLAAVREARQRAVDRWFADHAEEWDKLRSLEAPEAPVEAAILSLARARGIGRLLDIGTGTGRMLGLMGPHAASALGIDRSPEMLRIARARLDAAGLGRFEVRQADMGALPMPDASADTVIIHQVLHFSDSPGAAIAEAARVLAPGGQLIVVDHAAHGEEELRDRFRHVRLGFSNAEMASMFAAAGLAEGGRLAVDGPRIPVLVWQGLKPCPKP